jgi:replication fork protection complex subunit Tof1/Swi1
VIKADNSGRKIAMFKNGHLRLLMTLVGFQRDNDQDDPEGSWSIPSSISADQLQQSLDLIKSSEFSPPVFDNGYEAGDLIGRKSGQAAKKRAVFDDEENDMDDEDEEILFPIGGPTAMKKSDALKALKKNRRRRRKEGTEDAEDDGPSDEVLKARAEARRLKELEKHRKIKSDLRIHSSDEEYDEERDLAFFAREEQIRERSKITIMKELLGVGKEKEKEISNKKSGKKRQSSAISVGHDDDQDDDMRERSSSTAREEDDGLANSEPETTDTPMSSPHLRPSKTKRRKVTSEDRDDVPSSPARSAVVEIIKGKVAALDDDEDEDEIPVARPARQRVRAGFIVDSSDED